MTWYEQEDIQVLYKEMLAQQQNQPKPPSREELKSKVAALLVKHSTKDLQTSLTSVRLGKTLRQFTFPAFHAIAPNAKPSVGMIYYNPAYVKHLLANAENIANCNPSAPPRPGRAGKGRGCADRPCAGRKRDPPGSQRSARQRRTAALSAFFGIDASC